MKKKEIEGFFFLNAMLISYRSETTRVFVVDVVVVFLFIVHSQTAQTKQQCTISKEYSLGELTMVTEIKIEVYELRCRRKNISTHFRHFLPSQLRCRLRVPMRPSSSMTRVFTKLAMTFGVMFTNLCWKQTNKLSWLLLRNSICM